MPYPAAPFIIAQNMSIADTVNSNLLQSVDAFGNAYVTAGGKNTVSVTPTANTVIKATPGRLCKILVTTANSTNPILIYDNATTNSGTIIGVVPASAAIGAVVDMQSPASNGITIAGTASAGTLTVSWD